MNRGFITALALTCSTLSYSNVCTSNLSSSFSKKITQSTDRVSELPGFGCVNDIELAGTLPINSSSGLFYWFVESESKDSDVPVVLWLNGGPGSSSLYGFFLENGPYRVEPDLKLVKRRTSWSKVAHYLVIDQPAGVGFSYGTVLNESQAMDELYTALSLFYNQYPELRSHPLYIAGQSYAGKYIPQLALRILNGNEKSPSIRLKGILIGDGWVNPLLQQSSDADYAYAHGLVDMNGKNKIIENYRACAQEIQHHTPSSRLAHERCGQMQETIKKSSGCQHLTNVGTCNEPDDNPMKTYLRQPTVRQALHVDPRAKPYSTFDLTVGARLAIGEQDSVAELYTSLLNQNIKVIIYNGLDDGTDSNFIGTDLWLSDLSWSKANHFTELGTCIWYFNQEIVGYAKEKTQLIQLKIRQAGHLMPADQPKVALDLLTRAIKNDSFCASSFKGKK